MRRSRWPILSLSAVMAVLALLCACSNRSHREGKPDIEGFPAGSPMADVISFEYAVYMLPAADKDPSLVLRQELAGKYAGLKLVAQIPKEPREPVLYAHIQKNVQKEYAPPDLRALQYSGRGITKQQAHALQQSKEAFIMEFSHPKGSVWTALRTANSLVEEMARRTGGLIWDEETREVFTPDAWHKERLATWAGPTPDISTQTVIHIYNNGEYERAITLGMIKVGLPDVFVEETSWLSTHQVGDLINIFCQAMAEGATFEKPTFKVDLQGIKNPEVRNSQQRSLKANASGTACLALKQGKGGEGDPENRLIQITPDRYSGPDLHAKQEQMLNSFFGWEDAVHKVRHSEELLAASRKAKAKLPALQQAFVAGLEPGEFIQVKAPFPTPDGGREWMWVEITGWKGTRIKGLLGNEPFNVPNLHSGQIVEVQQNDVFDYIRTYPDKHTEGNTTGDIIKRMDESKDNASDQPKKQPVTVDCRVE